MSNPLPESGVWACPAVFRSIAEGRLTHGNMVGREEASPEDMPGYIPDVPIFTADQMRAHAAAEVAALTAENARLKADIASTNERWEKSHQTALAIQDERDRLREELAGARVALIDAKGSIGYWSAYAPGYFKKKHKFSDDLRRVADAISAIDAAMREKG